jgi:hypothetical protein
MKLTMITVVTIIVSTIVFRIIGDYIRSKRRKVK